MQSTRPTISSMRAEAERRHDAAQLLGDEEQVVDDVLGLAREAFARSTGSCVATPTGHVLRWHLRIMMQPLATSGAVAKPNSSAPSSAANATSRPVLSCPSTCRRTRPRSSFITSTCCVSARPSSHGVPACWIDDSGEAPVPPSWPRDEDDVGVRLGHAGRDGADAGLAHQLHADARARVDVLQVEDELRQILDRVDVVVRRRRDQRHARRRVAHARDDRVDLVARAAARLRRAWRPGPS